MTHLSLNLRSGSAARVAARRAKRLCPFAVSGEGGGPASTPPPKTTVIIEEGGENPLTFSEPFRMFLKVLSGDKEREQGSPRWLGSRQCTRHVRDIPKVILGFTLARPGSKRGRGSGLGSSVRPRLCVCDKAGLFWWKT